MSAQDQLGVWKSETGFAFRVWAPNASDVSVVGDFNEWDWSKNTMARDKMGCWFADVPEANLGQEYRFEISNGSDRFLRVDPYTKAVVNSVGNGIIADLGFDWGDDQYSLPPRNEIVIYEMHIGTFHMKHAGSPATFDDAIEKLDHLVSLGINVVEIMPCAEFAGDLSWGYNPAHLFAVEEIYGGPIGLKRFIRACHLRGIGVILDVVYNHFGPSDLSLWQFDGWSENGKGGIYFYNDWKSTTPWGDTRPDYGRQEVRRYILDNARYWLQEFRIDGLRLDMTLFIRHVSGNGDPAGEIPEGWSLAQAINDMVHNDFPGKIMIAEDLQNSDYLTKITSDGGAGFDLQWDARFVHPIRRMVSTPNDQERSTQTLVSAANASYNGDCFQRVIYSESHDEVANGKARVTTEVNASNPTGWHAKKRSTLAAAIAMTSPGVPMLFQGQEMLEDEWFRDTDPIDWSRATKFAGVVKMYSDLIRLRRNLEGLSKGLTGSGFAVLYQSEEQRIVAIHRWFHGGVADDVVVVINLSTDSFEAVEIPLPTAGSWQLRFNSDWKGYSEDFGDYASSLKMEVMSAGQIVPFRLAPYSVQILVLCS